jgi:hypothetical protein
MNTSTKERHVLGRLLAMPIDMLNQANLIKIDSRFRNLISAQARERRHRVERRAPAPPALPDRQNPGDRRKRTDRRQTPN